MNDIKPTAIAIDSDNKLTLHAKYKGLNRSYTFTKECGEFQLICSDEQFQLDTLDHAHFRAWSTRSIGSLASAYEQKIALPDSPSLDLLPLSIELDDNLENEDKYLVTLENAKGEKLRMAFAVSGNDSKIRVELGSNFWIGHFKIMQLTVESDQGNSNLPLIEAILCLHQARLGEVKAQQINTSFLQHLLDRGLYVSQPYPQDHGWSRGVRIGKPSNVEGNHIPGYEASFIVIGDMESPPEMDAPMVALFRKDNKWIVHSQESTPKMGIGDFQNIWETPEEAIEDILDFYFGDPTRMNAKAK